MARVLRATCSGFKAKATVVSSAVLGSKRRATKQRLASLTTYASDLVDLAPIAHLTKLVELRLGLSELQSIDALSGFERLKALSLTGCGKLTNLDVLGKLAGLKWLGFPPFVSQDQFAKVIREHPDLEVVELLDCENVRDLSPLAGLERLETLVLRPRPPPSGRRSGAPADLAPLRGLKSLRLLVLPEKVFDEKPEEVKAIEAALPGALVVAGGFCLGSGWVLLLVPVAAAAWLWRARDRRRLLDA